MGWDGGEMGKESNKVVGKESDEGEMNVEDGVGGFLTVKLIMRGSRHKQKLKKS